MYRGTRIFPSALQPEAVVWLRTPEELLEAKWVSGWRGYWECLRQRAQGLQRPGGRNVIAVDCQEDTGN